jgi:hypothetical protein
MARLRTLAAEYRGRIPAEQEAERARTGENAKVAQVIHSTG